GSLNDADPFVGLPMTNHGEGRIKNCVKYNLGDGWRLVTTQTDKTCTFLFVGDHEDTERWVNAHKGESIGIKDGHLVRIPGVGADPTQRTILVRHHGTPLIDKLDVQASDHLLEGLPANLVRKFGLLDGGCSPQELDRLVCEVSDNSRAELIRNVL